MGSMLVDDLSETFEANAILAGENVLEEIDYDGKCDTLARVMRSNYAYFDLPYNGYNRHGDEMVSTPPRSGDPGILGTGGARHYWMLADADAADADTEGGEGGGPSRGPRRAENVNYNGNRYFYHSDHLGSSSLVTDASGNVTQQIDYLPYGEVFLEKRSDVDYHTPYKFNGKELDEETGLYYYGARYMNPRLSIWYATDPLQESEFYCSTYTYAYDSPIKYKDEDGRIPLETIWDASNVVSGISSLINNVHNGNYGSAAVDGLGVVLDAAATVLPYVPGGASTAIKSYRAGKAVAGAYNKTKTVSKSVSKTITKHRGHNSVSRKGAFNQAKRDSGIPRKQHPKRQSNGKQYIKTPMKDRNGKLILGQDGKPIYTREYQFDSPDNGVVIIQDHSAGHPYFGGEAASPHFNVRRADNKRNSSVPGTKKHYNYNK
jgi:RHS repeat-associated protein